MKNKKKILVDITYGMSFRNMVLNEKFWSYLTSNYHVDVITPLKFSSGDIERLGISNIYDFSPQNLSFFKRIFLSANFRAINTVRLMYISDFFLKQFHGWPLVSRFHQSMQGKDELTIDLFFWSAVKRTFLGRFIKRIINFFPIFHPVESIFKKNSYEFLINTHTSELSSVLTAKVANKKNIPVISFPMGLDNIMHGPILFKPAKILFWGEDQKIEFERFQVNWNNDLSNVEQRVLGNLIFDTLKIKEKKIDIKDLYDINQETSFLLFCTMFEMHHPGQIQICEDIIKFLDEFSLTHKLIIRLRPGADLELWKNFSSRHSERVILQVPSGASFDKSSLKKSIDVDKEIEDIAIYASTVSQSSIVISRAHSTTYTDALFLNTPSILSQYYPFDVKRTKGFKDMWSQVCTFYPHHKKGYNFAHDKEELTKYLTSIFSSKTNDIEPHQKKLLEKQLNVASNSAGQIAIDEIKSFQALIDGVHFNET